MKSFEMLNRLRDITEALLDPLHFFYWLKEAAVNMTSYSTSTLQGHVPGCCLWTSSQPSEPTESHPAYCASPPDSGLPTSWLKGGLVSFLHSPSPRHIGTPPRGVFSVLFFFLSTPSASQVTLLSKCQSLHTTPQGMAQTLKVTVILQTWGWIRWCNRSLQILIKLLVHFYTVNILNS